MKKIPPLLLFLSFSVFLFSAQVLNIRVSENPGFERIVIEGESAFTYRISSQKNYLIIDFPNVDFPFKDKILGGKLVKGVSWDRERKELKIYYNKPDLRFVSFTLNEPFKLVIDFSESSKSEVSVMSQQKFEREIITPEKGSPSVMKSSPKIIVIDPGHGGEEDGAIGPTGLKEKNVVLSIAKKLKKNIEERMGIRVVLTREEDRAISLDERVSIANNMKADLFISIHANGSVRRKASGAEVYFLSLNATDEDAKLLSQIENFGEDKENSDLKLILWDMAQSLYLKESSTLAEFIQNEMNALLKTRGRGVKQAPFKVLMGVASPAVLVEVAFITNPEEEKKMKTDSFQEKIAESIYIGILRYTRQRHNQ
ncbi:MAG: N-acetylmuramoyl-L-alanine amidase family protein [Candidatus Aminicenantia bacterium]